MKDIIPAAALQQHVAILGKTGSGKTSTAKLAVEQVAAEGARVIVLDPIKSDWWGLTSSADGKRPGLPFHILGGPHGHVPLHAAAGKAIGELVGRGDLRQAIIDMADFEPGGQLRFFVDFAPALLRSMRGVVYLVIEEAHLFAPKERSGMGSEQLAIHWAKTIATAGRSKGIRLMVLSQRTQALHNAVLGSCDTLIAHRFTAPADQDPVLKWLKANVEPDVYRDVADSLSSLRTGEGWICSGEAQIFERRQFPRIHTYDNSATPTDDEHRTEVATAPVDREALRAILGAAVKEAEGEDPKALRARIAELEEELAADDELGPGAEQLNQARTEGWQEGVAHGRAEAIEAFSALGNAVEAAAGSMCRTIQDSIDARLADLRGDLPALTYWPMPAPIPANTTVHRLVPIRDQSGPKSVQRAPSTSLPAGEERVLTAAAQHPEGVTPAQLTVLLGYKRSSRNTYVQRLREKGFVRGDGERILATPAGMKALGPDFKPLPKGAALRKHYLEQLPEGERRVLALVLDAWPKRIEREEISERTGYKRSSRNTYLQRLAARQLVTTEGDGAVRASPNLFE